MSFPKRRQSPSPVHPGGVDMMVSKFPGASALVNLRGAVAAAAADYKAVVEATARMDGDRTITEGRRLVRQAKFARDRMGKAADSLAKARAATLAGIAMQDREIATVFDFAGRGLNDVQLATEIRSYFRTMSQGDRMAALTTAMKQHDLKALEAIGAAPGYLSGLPDDLHSRVRDTVLSVRAPDVVAMRASLVEGEQAAGAIEDTIMQSVADLIDLDTAAAFERSSTDD